MSELPIPADSVLEGTASQLTLAEIIAAIREAEQDWLPWDAIRAANGRIDEITPYLINLLQELASEARGGKNPRALSNGAIVALSLLAEFQARESLPVLCDLLMLPGERVQWLFQPEDCELLSRCLASLMLENPELIEQLLDNERLSAFVREDICQVYWFWLRDGKLNRATAADNLLRRLKALPKTGSAENWPLILAANCCRMAESGAVDLEAVANAAGTTVAYLSEFVKNSDENYGQTLASLPETHQGFLAELQRYYPDSPEHLTALLNRNYTHNLPRKLIRQLQKHGPEAISSPLSGLLRDESQRLAQALKNGEDDPCCTDGPVFAVYLLTEARCREALPAIIEAISLPGEGPFLLFGDFVTERLNRTLALLGSGSLSSIDALIRDNRLNEYVRSAASGAYHYLVRDGHLTRVEAIAALSQHLEWAIEQQDSSLATSLAADLANFGAWEAAELYDRAFDLKLVDPSMIGRFEIARTPEAGVADFEKYQSWLAASDFDSVEELSRWHCYQPERPRAPRSSYWDFSPPNTLVDEGNFKPNEAVRAPSATIRNTAPAVGRNDACPCGSGKKYKKCCLRGE